MMETAEEISSAENTKSVDIPSIRQEHFSRMNAECVYLDYAGAGQFPESCLSEWTKFISSKLLANPHSAESSEASRLASQLVSRARSKAMRFVNLGVEQNDRVAKFLGCEETHEIVFVKSATDACKLVAHSFPWSEANSTLFLHKVNHTSVVGMSGVAPKTIYVDSAPWDHPVPSDAEIASSGPSLFAYPLQCNMTGERYFYEKKPSTNILHLVDAASYLASSPLTKEHLENSDFLALSFYKIFGFPSSVGALLCKKDTGCKVLLKKYFGGGTVKFHTTCPPSADFRDSFHERFEDGTLPFFEILALPFLIDFWNTQLGGMHLVQQHCTRIQQYAFSRLEALEYSNGTKLVVFYSHKENQGPIINLNLQTRNEEPIGYSRMRKIASISGIQLRTGTFCNSGALAKHLGLTWADFMEQKSAGRVCWSDVDLVNGKHTGSIRLSFGAVTTTEDIDRFIHILSQSFLYERKLAVQRVELPTSSVIESIQVYPVKSCNGVLVQSAELTNEGLRFDRMWTIFSNLTGETVTLKRFPKLALLVVSIEGDSVQIRIPKSQDSEEKLLRLCPEEKESVGQHLSLFLEHSVSIRQSSEPQTNAAPLLLVNNASLQALKDFFPDNDELQKVGIERFRANIVISCDPGFCEEQCRSVDVSGQILCVSNECTRCQVVNVDKEGRRSKEPFYSLSRCRKNPTFGVYLSGKTGGTLQVGHAINLL